MVSVCLPSDALLQHLPSYLGFSYLGRGLSLHGCSSKVQSLLLTLDEGYLLTAALSDLHRGIAPLGHPAPTQPRLLGRGVGPPGRRPGPRTRGSSSRLLPLASGLGRGVTPLVATPDLGLGVAPLGHSCAVQPGTLSHCTSPQTWGNSSWPLPLGHGVLLVSDPDLGHGRL